MGVYAVVQYAMSTVTTRSTRVLVVGVYKSTAVYVAESIAVVWLCIYSSTTVASHNYTEAQLLLYVCIIY